MNDSLFPGHEYIWLADYSVRRRKKKLFDKDERWRHRFHGKSFKPTPYFNTEFEARSFMVEQAEKELQSAHLAVKRADRKLQRARMKLAEAYVAH